MVTSTTTVIGGWLCFIAFCNANEYCDITQHPKTTVALNGSNVTFICVIQIGGGVATSVIFNDTLSINNVNRSEYGERGIYWECEGKPKTTFYIYILADEVNNGTSVFCGFGECTTKKAYLIVVTAPPPSPDPPVVTVFNLTTLNISWSPPWIHPVNNYTLFITNNNTGITINHTTVNTQYMLHDEDNSECNILEFTVSANTDVGNSGLSENTVKGFPKNLVNESDKTLNITVIKSDCGSVSPTYQVIVEAPVVCSYETLYYEYMITDVEKGWKIDDLFGFGQDVFFYEEIEDGSIYHISVNITNEAQQTLEVIKTINTSSLIQSNLKEVTLHPRTTVALLNETAYFSCYDNETGNHQITVHINGDIFTKHEQENIDKGINRDFIVDENNKEIGFNISIIATEENNKTSIQCFFSPCFSNQAFLIVVEAPPTSPDPPIVTIINLTTLNISWSPPWTHPVNNYTLFITNNNTGITMNYTTVNTHYILYDEDNSECNVLEFTVSANTDVGNSGLSEKTIKGFPKSLYSINQSTLTNDYELVRGSNGELKSIIINIEYPPVCDYEILQFEFELINNNTGESKVILTQDISNVTINIEDDFINSGDILTMRLKITNEPNEEIPIILFTNVMINVSNSLRPTSSSSTSISSPTVSTTVQEPKKPFFTKTVIIIIAAAGGGVLVMALITMIAICCAVVKKQIKKEKSTGTTAVDQIDFSLPAMVTNEHYVNPQEIFYDSIPNIKNLMPVEKQIPSPMSPTTPGSDAPLLPPPRSPKIPFYSQVCNQELNNPPLQSVQEEEYVEMSSQSRAHTQSPRYIKAPTTAFFNENSLTRRAQMHNTSTSGMPDSHLPSPDEPSITVV